MKQFETRGMYREVTSAGAFLLAFFVVLALAI
jgi:hypothetical protein